MRVCAGLATRVPLTSKNTEKVAACIDFLQILCFIVIRFVL